MKLRLPKQLCIALSAIALAAASQQAFADTTVQNGETLTVGSGNASSQFGAITVENGAAITLNDGAVVDAQFTYSNGAQISMSVAANASATWNKDAQPTTSGTGVTAVTVGQNATLTLQADSNTQFPIFTRGAINSSITLESGATLISNTAVNGWENSRVNNVERAINLKAGSQWQVKSQEWLNNAVINLEGGDIELSADMKFERNLNTFHVLNTATTMSTITGSAWLCLGGGGTSQNSTVNGYTGDLFEVKRGNFTLEGDNRADLEISAKIGKADSLHTRRLLKTGNGVLRLTSTDNNYDQGTYIHEGTLIAVGATLGTGTVAVNEGALLQYESATAVNNALEGAGRVEYTQNFSGDFTYTGNASAFTGTLALKRDESGHGGDNQGGGIRLSDNFAGVVELQGRAYANNLSLGNAQKLVLNTDGVQNTTGLWAKTAVTLDKEVEIIGSGRSDIFLSADITLSQNLKAAAGTTLGIKNGSKLILNGAENAIDNLAIDNSKVQVNKTATLTFVNQLNGGSKNLSNVIGAGTIALTEQHGITSTHGQAAVITLDNNFTGTLHYQGGLQLHSNPANPSAGGTNLGGASTIVFSGTSNILFNSSAQGTYGLSQKIELESGTTLALSTWGDSSSTSDNVLSGDITGGTDTIIRKRDGGAITVSGNLSAFHGTFEMNEGNYGFVINVAADNNNSTDATFKGGLQLRKTGAGNLTLSGSVQSSVKNEGSGTLTLSGTIAAGKQVRNTGAEGSFVLDNVTLASGNGRLNIKEGTITFRNGITDNSTEANDYAVTVEGNGTADFTSGEYDFSAKNLAAWDGSTVKVSNSGTVKAGAMFWSPDGKYGTVTVESTGTLIVGQGNGALVKADKAGVSHTGRIQVKTLTNAGTTELHGYADINSVSNNGGTLSLLGSESKAFGTFTQSGETAALVVAGDLNVETSIATDGTMEGSIDLQDNASLVLKNLNNAAKFELNNLSIGSGTLSAYTDTQLDAQHEADLTVTGTLTASNSSTLNANLTVGSNATLNLGTEGLTMGSDIKLSTGSHITLTGDILNALAGLSWQEGSVTLFSGVDAFYVDGEQQSYGYSQSANNFFNIATLPHGYDLTLQYKASDNGDGGTLSLWMETPEPATATLSLLALAALAARRKRK